MRKQHGKLASRINALLCPAAAMGMEFGEQGQQQTGSLLIMLGGWTGGSVPLVGWCVVAEESTPFIVRTISSDSDSLSTATNAIFSGQLFPLSLPVSQCDARKGATEPDRHAPLIPIAAEATELVPRGLQASTAPIKSYQKSDDCQSVHQMVFLLQH